MLAVHLFVLFLSLDHVLHVCMHTHCLLYIGPSLARAHTHPPYTHTHTPHTHTPHPPTHTHTHTHTHCIGPSLKAPFKNSFYLRDEYKSASKKAELVKNLRFRIGLLALLNLIFCPVIFIYQLLYAFFSYAEIVKREPGTFGKRRWSMYGR